MTLTKITKRGKRRKAKRVNPTPTRNQNMHESIQTIESVRFLARSPPAKNVIPPHRLGKRSADEAS